MNYNEFMNALWNSVGREISGRRHDGSLFRGKIVSVRVKSGVDISLSVEDGSSGECFPVLASDVIEGARKLRVWF